VHRDDRPRPRADLRLDPAGIERVSARVDVDEDRDPELMQDRCRVCREVNAVVMTSSPGSSPMP
jgi:hypothetical protein